MRILKSILIVVFLLLLAAPLNAVYVWDGQGGYSDYNFSSDINWDPDGAPPVAINDSIIFGTSGGSVALNDMGTITGVQSISFNGNINTVANGSFSLESGATIGGTGSGSKSLYSNIYTNGPGGVEFNSNTFNLTLGGVREGAVAGGTLTMSSSRILTLLGSGTYTGGTIINGGTVRFNNTSSFGTGPITISGGNGAIQAINPILTLSNNISVENTRTLTVSGTNNMALSGDITGAGALTKDGTGTLTLSGTNTYTGTTTISNGTLAVADGSAIADTRAVSLANVASANFELLDSETIGSLAGGGSTGGNVDLNANTLTVGDASSTTYAGTISGTGTLAKQGAGALTLSGNNTYSGGTTMSAGSITLGNNNALGTGMLSITSNSALQSNDDSRSVSNAISINNGSVLSVFGTNNLALTGDISGDGRLRKTDSGSLTLTGANNYTGVTYFFGGKIILGNDSALGTNTLLITGNGEIQSDDDSRSLANAVFLFSSQTLTVTGSDNLALGGTISGSGTLNKSGSGALTLSGTNPFSGGTTLNDGTIILGSDTALGTGTLTLSGDGIIMSNDDSRSVGNNINTSGNALTVSGSNNLELSGAISGNGSLTKSGSSVLTLSGNNSYTAGTIITAGTLIGNTTSLQDAITNNAAVVFDQDTAGTYSGIMSGTGTLTKLGTGNVTLSGTNSYSGGTTVSAGTLTGNTTSLQGDITNNAAVIFDQTINSTYSGIISGTGTLTKSGSGILTLSGNNTFTGTTTLSAGTLNLSGQVCGDILVNGGTLMGAGTINNGSSLTLNSGGLLTPGNSIDTLTITGDFVLDNGSTLEIEVEKDALDNLDSDLLDVSGSATLESGSIINVTDLTPTDRFIGTGDIFTIITTGGGVSDNGASITSASATLGFDGSVSGDDYILTATRNAFGASSVGNNNTALLQAIDMDMGSAGGDYVDIINVLSTLDASALNTAAEQLSPLSHANLGGFNAGLLHDMGSDMGGYLVARRNNTEHNAKFAALRNSDLLLADASKNPDTLAYVISETERRRVTQEGTEKQTNSFFRPFGVFFSQDSSPTYVGFQAQAVGAQFGADQVFGTNWIIGIGGAYSHSCLDFDEGFGDADIDSFRIGPYATYFVDRFYVDSSVSLGYHLNNTRREIGAGINRTAEAHYDAYDLSAYVGGGYEFNVRQWILSPTISAQYICYRNESFKESGAGAAGLNVSKRTQESLLSRFGIRLYTVTMVDTMKLAPEFFVGYAHEFMDEEDISARFAGGVTKFSADVDSNRDDSVYFGAGLSGLLNENTSAFIRYEGEAYGGSRSSAIKVGMTIRF